MKHIVRFLILIVVFAASVFFFGSRIGTKSFSKTIETVELGEAALPTVSVVTCGEKISCLYGYTSNLDTTLNRADLIPVDSNMEFMLDINEYDMTIRRLKYEIMDVSGKEELDSGTINAFDKDGVHKKVRIRVKADLQEGTEYAVRVTLINDVGKRIYYYFRLKQYKNPQLSPKLAFLREFLENTRSTLPEARDKVIPYLEMKSDAPSDTFGYVDIHSNYQLVCWGDLAPETVVEPVITVTEFYQDIMTATVRSIVKVNAGYGDEFFRTEENFRIRYLGPVIHLLNYERTTQTLFDSDNASLTQSDLKLGLISGREQQLYPNEDYSTVAFVRNGSLYSYSLATNTISTVFASTEQYERMLGLQTGHDILVLKTEADGNITFMVSGYRNRGSYEGRVGLFVYRYLAAEGRLEELVYAPVNTTYQLLRGEVGAFAYVNEFDVFFFMVNGSLYSYNLITEELSVLAEEIDSEDYVFSAAKRYLAYQERGKTDCIQLLFPETAKIEKVYPPQGEYIRLLGMSEDNLICGYGRESDIYENEDMSLTRALFRVEIRTAEGEVRKEYQKPGYFVESVQTDANVIQLYRLEKNFPEGYRETESDYILIRDTAVQGKVTLEKRITERMLTEYYVSFPSSFEMGELPKKIQAGYTVSSKDPTVRIGELERSMETYFVYCYGKIRQTCRSASEAILTADRVAGTVISEDGRIVWERGVKAASAEAAGVAEKRSGKGESSALAAVTMLLSKKGVNLEPEALEASRPVAELLEKNTSGRVLSLSGVTLDEVLYYIWRGQPVLVLGEQKEAVVLIAYSAKEVTYYDPAKGKRIRQEKDTVEKQFFNGKSYYFCFLPE